MQRGSEASRTKTVLALVVAFGVLLAAGLKSGDLEWREEVVPTVVMVASVVLQWRRPDLWILWSIIGLMVTVYLALKLNATARIR